MADRWWVDEDEEFCNPLLRWNDEIIAQITGTDEKELEAAYAALVAAVEAFQPEDEGR